MGCLFEGIGFLFESLFEILIEESCEFLSGWVPERMRSSVLRKTLSGVFYTLSLVAIFAFLFGIAVALFSEETVLDMWKFIFIPLAFIVLEIVLGIIAKRKRKN